MGAGVEYLVVVKSSPRAGKDAASVVNICTYGPSHLDLRLSSEADKEAMWAALQAKAACGEVLFAEDDAVVRCWTSEHRDLVVVLFDAGRSKLLASFEWELTNMLIQENCSVNPSP